MIIIKAIPTTYKGTKFRSKLEATWAKWLDKYNIIWSYETEGFDLDGNWYLPDFFLPEINTILEIKGALQGLEKARKLHNKIHELNIETTINQQQFKDHYNETIKIHFENKKTLKIEEEAGASVWWDPPYLFLLGSYPVPSLYDIEKEGSYVMGKCSKCDKTWISLYSRSWGCRACVGGGGKYDLLFDENGFPSIKLLATPRGW